MNKMGVSLVQQATLSLQQKLIITPQLQQAIKLLQLNHIELAEMLQEELLTNPVLEMIESSSEHEPNTEPESSEHNRDEYSIDDNDFNSLEMQFSEPTQIESNIPPSAEVESAADTNLSQQELFNEVDWDAYFQDLDLTSQTLPSTGKDYDPDLPSAESRLTSQQTLSQNLTWQLHLMPLSIDQQKMALLIIGYLNERGWLVIDDQNNEDPLDILAHQMESEPPSDISPSNGKSLSQIDLFRYWRKIADTALEAIHLMEPTGVGARSLQECLLLQSWQRDDLQDPDLLERLIRNHLHNIERKNYAAIAKSIKVSLEDIIEHIKIIRQLDPYPSRNFIEQPTAYISPDIYIRKIGEDYHVTLNDDGLPRLKINSYYKRLLHSQKQEGREFIQEKLRNATWLLRSIQQRKRTIHKVTQSIVERQRDFFEHGIQHLKPMILRDVAEDIEMHESTISRVTTNKYVHTPQGVFELKYFFTSSLQSSEGGDDVSSLMVKDKIKQLISDEEPKNPLSDQEIVKILEKDGIAIARRTVAKYRGILNIPSSSKRKRPY
jgi:RNA polymerase sigma-54 factor